MVKEPFRILLIDDSPNRMTVCRNALRKDGYEIRILPGCQFLKKTLYGFRPHLVFINDYTPDLSGLLGIITIKMDRCFRRLPVIYFSDEQYKIDLAAAAGADQYLFKPAERAEMPGIAAISFFSRQKRRNCLFEEIEVSPVR